MAHMSLIKRTFGELVVNMPSAQGLSCASSIDDMFSNPLARSCAKNVSSEWFPLAGQRHPGVCD